MNYTALMYVDNGDFPTLAEIGKESMRSVALKHQQTITYWAGRLRTTGGTLKPSKCIWHPIKWEWKNGKAQGTKTARIKSNITVTGPDVITTAIAKLDYDSAREVMGLWQVPSGQMKSQLDKLRSINKEYITILENVFLYRKTMD